LKDMKYTILHHQNSFRFDGAVFFYLLYISISKKDKNFVNFYLEIITVKCYNFNTTLNESEMI